MKSKITRRTFVKASSAFIGGFVGGFVATNYVSNRSEDIEPPAEPLEVQALIDKFEVLADKHVPGVLPCRCIVRMVAVTEADAPNKVEAISEFHSGFACCDRTGLYVASAIEIAKRIEVDMMSRHGLLIVNNLRDEVKQAYLGSYRSHLTLMV